MKITRPRHFFKLILLILSIALTTYSCSNKITVVRNLESDYHIILPAKAKMDELKAASLIQRYVEESTGVKLPIMRDREIEYPHEICLGMTNRFDHPPDKKPEEHGYRLVTSSEKLFIYGGSPRGTLNGVTSFLEEYLGARVYTSTVRYIPDKEEFIIPANLDELYNPPITFRTTHYRDTWAPPYALWHKLNHAKDGGHPDWGYWVHTFNTLVPPGQYYNEHPEYYAEINGNRVPTQLCLSNPEVYNILVQNLRKAMDEQPEKTYWSVSQNDNVSYCQCEECRKVDETQGTPMGSVLTFVNKVAAEFPDKVISTLAYQYSRQAPETIVPADNVNIMLCTIELNRSKPISTDPGSASFRKDLEDWGMITDDILLWDYVVQFENLVSPFPNLRVLQPNLQYFVENNARKHFQQGNREVGGEFAELRAYLISKLLWDPYIDIDMIMDDFLFGYYGKAGKYIRRYIDRMHDELEKSGQDLNIFGHPSGAAGTWLSSDKMRRYDSYFDKAERSVRDNPELLERVKIARLPLKYAKVEISLRLGTAKGGMYIKGKDGKWKVREDIPANARALVELANKQGVTRFKEWHTTPDEYLASLERTWDVDMQEHLAYGKKVELLTTASMKYSAGNKDVLTDGLRGPQLTFLYNWLGFEGEECDALVDLGAPQKISQVSTSWLQDTRSWIFLPREVKVYGSNNQEEWFPLGEYQCLDDQERASGVTVHDFVIDLDEPSTCRYVKINTSSFRLCPDWHPGSGSPAWIFTDEIIVK
jgi:hypothetical protein